MNIENPKACVGEKAMVRNYRRRPEMWEEGEILSASFVLDRMSTRGERRYEVWVDRASGRYAKGGYRIMVGQDGIR